MDLSDIVEAIQSRRVRVTLHADEDKKSMRPFDKCPVCGGELVEKDVERVLRGGVHTAVVSVHADVCQRCGEHLYSLDTVELFDRIRARLKNNQTDGLEPIGQSFRVSKALSALPGVAS